MAHQDEIHLEKLAGLEREVRRQYGRTAEGMLMDLPLDYAKRVAALRRLAGVDPADQGADNG